MRQPATSGSGTLENDFPLKRIEAARQSRKLTLLSRLMVLLLSSTLFILPVAATPVAK